MSENNKTPNNNSNNRTPSDNNSDDSNNNNNAKEEEESPPQNDKPTLRRVKLYYLNEEGKWYDKGTGHVSTETRKNDVHVIMRSEGEDNAILLDTKISMDDIYQLQGESLIVWCDQEISTDMALSFQESEGCQQIWDEIRKSQGRSADSKEIIAKNLLNEKENEECDTSQSLESDSFSLPAPELGNLQKVLDIMTTSPKHRVARALLENNYVSELCDVFKIAEDLEDMDSLHILFQIFKTAVLLDAVKLIELFISDEYIMKVMGALEYDPDLPVLKANHRRYLNQIVVFKEVVPFSNRTIINKIHQTFRVQYLKDIVLPRYLDDQTFNTLSTIIFFNNTEIVKAIREDYLFLDKLFQALKTNPTRDHARLLLEFNNMIKTVQDSMKNGTIKTLLDHGLLSVLEQLISNRDETIRHCAADIVCSLIQHDTMIIRRYVLDEKRKQQEQQSKLNFLASFIKGITDETELGVQVNLTESLRTLVDPETLGLLKDEFLNLFYQDYMDMLVSPLHHVNSPKEAKIHVLDLLGHFIQPHGYRSKNYILRHNILQRAVECVKTTEKDLILAVIRFLKSCVEAKEVFINAAIVKHDLFDPIMSVWRQHANKYNLMNSAILGLFDTILKEKANKLIVYLVEKHRADLEKVTYSEIMQNIIQKHDDIVLQDVQQHEITEEQNRPLFTGGIRGTFTTTGSEDEYFEKRLVNYDSDEEKDPDSSEVPETAESEEQAASFIDLPSVSGNNHTGAQVEDDRIFPQHEPDQLASGTAGLPLTPFKIDLSAKNKRQIEEQSNDDSPSKKRKIEENKFT